MPKSFRITDSAIHICQERDEGYLAEAYEAVKATLRHNKFSWRKDPAMKRYKTLQDNHDYGRRGDLEFHTEIHPAMIKVEFFQNIVHENRNGGRYDFDKMMKMPYLLRLLTQLMHAKLKAALEALGFVDQTEKEAGTIEERILASRKRSGHWPEGYDLDKRMAYNKTDADGAIVADGDVRCFRNDKGHILRGRAFYNLNSMWKVVVPGDSLWAHQISVHRLFTYDPAKHPRKVHPQPHRPPRVIPVAAGEGFKVTKVLTEQYVVRKGGDYAQITLTPTGSITITSSYGSYGHHFSIGNGKFLEFLIQCDRSYLMGKFAKRERNVWDAEKSKTNLRKKIDEAFLARRIDSEGAKVARRVLNSACTDSADVFFHELWNASDFINLDSEVLGNCMHYDPDPDATGLLDRLWPAFIEAIKAEVGKRSEVDAGRDLKQASRAAIQFVRQRNPKLLATKPLQRLAAEVGL